MSFLCELSYCIDNLKKGYLSVRCLRGWEMYFNPWRLESRQKSKGIQFEGGSHQQSLEHVPVPTGEAVHSESSSVKAVREGNIIKKLNSRDA